MIDTLTLDDFRGRLQQTFSVRREHGLLPLPLTLIQLEELPARGQRVGARSRPFSLIVASPIDGILEQGTYAVAVPELTTLDLFVVPVGPSADRTLMCYQILFN